MRVELLDFGLVLGFGLRRCVECATSSVVASACVAVSLIRFVASFRLRKELAVEMFDLRDPFWNEGI